MVGRWSGWLVNRLPSSGWLSQGLPSGQRPEADWLNRGEVPFVGCESRHAGRCFPIHHGERNEQHMIIGIDPHKMSHTANAVNPATNTTAASLRVDASLAGYRELMR